MEEEAERRLAPRKIRVLAKMQIAPSPIFSVLRDVLGQKCVSVSHSFGNVVCAVVLTFVLWMCLLAKHLEVRLVTLFLNFKEHALVHLNEGVVVTNEHSFLLIIWHLLMEETLVEFEKVVHVN